MSGRRQPALSRSLNALGESAEPPSGAPARRDWSHNSAKYTEGPNEGQRIDFIFPDDFVFEGIVGDNKSMECWALSKATRQRLGSLKLLARTFRCALCDQLFDRGARANIHWSLHHGGGGGGGGSAAGSDDDGAAAPPAAPGPTATDRKSRKTKQSQQAQAQAQPPTKTQFGNEPPVHPTTLPANTGYSSYLAGNGHPQTQTNMMFNNSSLMFGTHQPLYFSDHSARGSPFNSPPIPADLLLNELGSPLAEQPTFKRMKISNTQNSIQSSFSNLSSFQQPNGMAFSPDINMQMDTLNRGYSPMVNLQQTMGSFSDMMSPRAFMPTPGQSLLQSITQSGDLDSKLTRNSSMPELPVVSSRTNMPMPAPSSSAPFAGKQRRLQLPGQLHNVPEQPPVFIKTMESQEVEQQFISYVNSSRQFSANSRHHGRAFAVVGMLGSGKSVLVSTVVRSTAVRKLFSDGIYWVNCRDVGLTSKSNVSLSSNNSSLTPSNFAVAAEAVFDPIGVRPILLKLSKIIPTFAMKAGLENATPVEMASLISQHLQSMQVLIVLDGVPNVRVMQMLCVTGTSPNSMIIATATDCSVVLPSPRTYVGRINLPASAVKVVKMRCLQAQEIGQFVDLIKCPSAAKPALLELFDSRFENHVGFLKRAVVHGLIQDKVAVADLPDFLKDDIRTLIESILKALPFSNRIQFSTAVVAKNMHVDVLAFLLEMHNLLPDGLACAARLRQCFLLDPPLVTEVDAKPQVSASKLLVEYLLRLSPNAAVEAEERIVVAYLWYCNRMRVSPLQSPWNSKVARNPIWDHYGERLIEHVIGSNRRDWMEFCFYECEWILQYLFAHLRPAQQFESSVRLFIKHCYEAMRKWRGTEFSRYLIVLSSLVTLCASVAVNEPICFPMLMSCYTKQLALTPVGRAIPSISKFVQSIERCAELVAFPAGSHRLKFMAAPQNLSDSFDGCIGQWRVKDTAQPKVVAIAIVQSLLGDVLIVTGHSNGRVKVWQASSAYLMYTLHHHSAAITSLVTLTKPGQDWYLASGALDGRVALFSGTRGQVMVSVELQHRVSALSFLNRPPKKQASVNVTSKNPAGSELNVVCGCVDGSVGVISTLTSEILFLGPPHNDAIVSIYADPTADPNIDFLSISSDGKISRWLADNCVIASITNLPSTNPLLSVAVFNDEKSRDLMIAWHSKDYRVEISSVATGEIERTLLVPESPAPQPQQPASAPPSAPSTPTSNLCLLAAYPSFDGANRLVVSREGHVLVFDSHSGRLLGSWCMADGTSSVRCLAVSSWDNMPVSYVVAGTDSGCVAGWNGHVGDALGWPAHDTRRSNSSIHLADTLSGTIEEGQHIRTSMSQSSLFVTTSHGVPGLDIFDGRRHMELGVDLGTVTALCVWEPADKSESYVFSAHSSDVVCAWTAEGGELRHKLSVTGPVSCINAVAFADENLPRIAFTIGTEATSLQAWVNFKTSATYEKIRDYPHKFSIMTHRYSHLKNFAWLGFILSSNVVQVAIWDAVHSLEDHCTLSFPDEVPTEIAMGDGDISNVLMATSWWNTQTSTSRLRIFKPAMSPAPLAVIACNTVSPITYMRYVPLVDDPNAPLWRGAFLCSCDDGMLQLHSSLGVCNFWLHRRAATVHVPQATFQACNIVVFTASKHLLTLSADFSHVDVHSKNVYRAHVIEKYDNTEYDHLLAAVFNEDTQTITALLKANRSLEALSAAQTLRPSLLCTASRLGKVSVISILRSYGAHVDARDGMFQTPLFEAIDGRQLMATAELLHPTPESPGADPNLRDYLNRTPLTLATALGAVDIVGCLIQAGADINAMDGNNCTPLMISIIHKNIEMLIVYMERGANLQCGNMNVTEFAASVEWFEGVQFLQRRSSRSASPMVDIQVEEMLTALRSGNAMEVYTCLANGGAAFQEKLRGQRGCGKALCAAAIANSAEICRVLVDFGCDVNAVDDMGRTALHEAAARGYEKVVSALLSCGADPNVTDNMNMKPFSGNPEIQRMLMASAEATQAQQYGNHPGYLQALSAPGTPSLALLAQHGLAPGTSGGTVVQHATPFAFPNTAALDLPSSYPMATPGYPQNATPGFPTATPMAFAPHELVSVPIFTPMTSATGFGSLDVLMNVSTLVPKSPVIATDERNMKSPVQLSSAETTLMKRVAQVIVADIETLDRAVLDLMTPRVLYAVQLRCLQDDWEPQQHGNATCFTILPHRFAELVSACEGLSSNSIAPDQSPPLVTWSVADEQNPMSLHSENNLLLANVVLVSSTGVRISCIYIPANDHHSELVNVVVTLVL